MEKCYNINSILVSRALLKKDCSYPAGKAWLGPPGRKERGGGKDIERRGTDIRQRKREQREIGLGHPDEREGQRERIERARERQQQ